MTRHHARRNLLALLLTVTCMSMVAGCEDYPDYVEVSAVTGAPPSRTAHITNSETEHSIHLSKGVALGLRCYDSCDGACIAPQFVIGDQTLLEAHEAYFAGSAGHVLFAKEAGTTTLVVDTTCAHRIYTVVITADE